MRRWSLALVVAGSLLICPVALAQENATSIDPAWVPPPPGSGVMSTSPMPRSADAPIQYCAYFSDGTSDCGYSALSDCEQTVRGIGGWCDLRPEP